MEKEPEEISMNHRKTVTNDEWLKARMAHLS
jgi:hypothetical protein